MKTYIWIDMDYDDSRIIAAAGTTVEKAREDVLKSIATMPEKYRNHVEWIILHQPTEEVQEPIPAVIGHFSKDAVYTIQSCAHCGATGEALENNKAPTGWVQRRYWKPDDHKGGLTVVVTGWSDPTTYLYFDSEEHLELWEAAHPNYRKASN